jgi:hypothetical protein
MRYVELGKNANQINSNSVIIHGAGVTAFWVKKINKAIPLQAIGIHARNKFSSIGL